MIGYTVTIDERRARCPHCGGDELEITPRKGELRCRSCDGTAREGADPVNHPPHYTRAGYECAEVVIALGLSYCLGNVLKYVWRCGHKADALQDLKKARWYLDREIRRREGDDDAS